MFTSKVNAQVQFSLITRFREISLPLDSINAMQSQWSASQCTFLQRSCLMCTVPLLDRYHKTFLKRHSACLLVRCLLYAVHFFLFCVSSADLARECTGFDAVYWHQSFITMCSTAIFLRKILSRSRGCVVCSSCSISSTRRDNANKFERTVHGWRAFSPLGNIEVIISSTMPTYLPLPRRI